MTCKKNEDAPTSPLQITADDSGLTDMGDVNEAIKKQDVILAELYSERRRRRIRMAVGSLFVIWLLYNSLVNVRNTSRISAEQRVTSRDDAILVECTTPHHACYDNANKKTGAAVNSIITTITNNLNDEATALAAHQDAVAAQNRAFIKSELQLLLDELTKMPNVLPTASTPTLPKTATVTTRPPTTSPSTTTPSTTLPTVPQASTKCHNSVLGICFDNLLG